MKVRRRISGRATYSKNATQFDTVSQLRRVIPVGAHLGIHLFQAVWRAPFKLNRARYSACAAGWYSPTYHKGLVRNCVGRTRNHASNTQCVLPRVSGLHPRCNRVMMQHYLTEIEK